MCRRVGVFVFYSNRAGCGKSLLISLVLSVIVIVVLSLLNGWF